MPADADLTLERSLWAEGFARVCSLDEVGRGCLAGPVTVGAVLVVPGTPYLPGLRDSKLLSAKRREVMAPLVGGWAADWAVGSASAAEIDEHGIVPALRLAAVRALSALKTPPDVVILDGDRDYLTDPDPRAVPDPFDPVPSDVRAVVKADLTVASCAAASIVAKVHRDRLMAAAHERDPRWAWDRNSGYSSPAHYAALALHAPSDQHRTSFRLTGPPPKPLSLFG